MALENGDLNVRLGDVKAILDSISDAFFSLNERWEYSYLNRQTEVLLARPASELLGKCILDVYPGMVNSAFERAYRKVLQEQVSTSLCAYYPDHDRWYDANIYPAPEGLFVYFRDVTTRVLEENRRDALSALNDTCRKVNNVGELEYECSRVLGETLKVSRVSYGTINPVTEKLHVVRDWTAVGVKSLVGTLSLRDYSSFLDELTMGRLVIISDVDNKDPMTSPMSILRERSFASSVNIPVIEKSQLVALLIVNQADARNWSDGEIAFIKNVADLIRVASDRIKSSEELDEVVIESNKRRRLYETFLENSPDLAYVFDLDHRFAYVNKMVLNIFGRPWDEVIGKNCLELGYERWQAEVHDKEIDEVVATKQPIRGEIPFTSVYGSRYYEYIFAPVFGVDGEVECIAGTTRDITERKRAEESLQESNQHKDEFLAMLAHELRNPLAPISAAAEVLQRMPSDEKMVIRTAQIIGRQVRHMTGLVDDLLDMSRLTRGLVSISNITVDLKSVIYSAVEQVRPFIERQRHHLNLELPPDGAYVVGDQKRLIQIVTNLLNNAAKYTPPGGIIKIKLEIESVSLALSVEDNGVGVPLKLQSTIFELFTQAERTPDRSQGGLGIGLALVKNLTVLHGGKISCFSEGKDKGSKFTLLLPRYNMQGESANITHEGIAKKTELEASLHILLVDDNEDAAQMLSLCLKTLGYQVSVEYTPQRALAKAKAEKFDVYVLDIGLPEMDGYELACQLRQEGKATDAVFIAATGYGHESDKLKALAAGFHDHLVKPVDLNKLARLLDRYRS